MAGAPASGLWRAFLIAGLIVFVAAFYFLIGSVTFAVVSGLVGTIITLLNAFFSPAKTKKGENWVVGAMKRTLVMGPYAKGVCILLWIGALASAAPLAWAAYEKRYNVDIEGVVIDKLRGTDSERCPVEAAKTLGGPQPLFLTS